MTSQPLRVLILEEHAFQRAVVVSQFKRLGHAVIEATHATEALALLESVHGWMSYCATCPCPAWMGWSFCNMPRNKGGCMA